VLWSGVCGGVVAKMEKIEGLLLVAGLERKKIRNGGNDLVLPGEKN